MKAYRSGWLISALALALFGVWHFIRLVTPIRTTGEDVPHAAVAGNPAGAMKQAKELMTEMQAHGMDYAKIPGSRIRQLAFLSDQRFNEDPGLRAPNTSAFAFPNLDGQQEIAFYCDTYARQNRSYYIGDRSAAKPSGSILVGYKNGKIEWVPVAQVRSIRNKVGQTVMAFPGMSSYRASLPVWFAYDTTPLR